MAQALYRTYRPKALDEVAGQKHITETLDKALKAGRISHAYLFTGPRGVGKTSVARILAHAINDLPYTDDSSHIDIIEIDAASNRRIDEIRDLRERVYISPSEAKYKVYIIDEVHMLTKEAFNALLKTLEEPPEHVVFILATTDVHKLPATIISRTQRYSFKPIDKDATIKQLEMIAKREKFKISPKALELLAEHADGSLRDAESILDQARNSSDDITEETVTNLLGLPAKGDMQNLLKLFFEKAAAAEVLKLLSNLYSEGFQASTIASALIQIIHQEIKAGVQKDLKQALELMAELIDVPASADPSRFLEITLLKNSAGSSDDDRQPAQKAVKAASTAPLKQVEQPLEKEQHVVKETPKIHKAETVKTEPVKPGNAIADNLWQDLLDALKIKYNTLYGIVKSATPAIDENGDLSLGFGYDFYRKRVTEANNKTIICNLYKDLTGQSVNLNCYLDKNIKAKPVSNAPVKTDSKAPAKDIANISNIFSGAEVIES